MSTPAAVVAAILTALATSVAALIAGLIARGVALANLRQAWINALRDDLADFLSTVDAAVRIESDVLHVIRVGNPLVTMFPKEIRERGQELVDKLELLSARIRLRLNPEETAHIELATMVEEMRKLKKTPTTTDLLDLASPILKREWQVTKYGELWPLVKFFKDPVGKGSGN